MTDLKEKLEYLQGMRSMLTDLENHAKSHPELFDRYVSVSGLKSAESDIADLCMAIEKELTRIAPLIP